MRTLPIAVVIMLSLSACAYLPQPHETGLTATGTLRPCPSQPHCVSSLDSDPDRYVAPLHGGVDPRATWQHAITLLTGLPRARVAELTDTYARVEVTSRLMRFVDDIELRLRPTDGTIDVRSSSRIGWWDGGVNRSRVEWLRAALSATSRP